MEKKLDFSQIVNTFQKSAARIDRAPSRSLQVERFWEKAASLFIKKTEPDFQGRALQKLQEWSTPHQEFLQNLLNIAIELTERYDRGEMGAVKSSGHDLEHVVHVCSQALEMTDGQVDKIGEYAVWELNLSAVLHDIGRWLGHGDALHSLTGSFLAAKTSGDLKDKESLSQEGQLIGQRIISHILGHSRGNNGDPVADLLRGADRLQIIPPYVATRSIIYDVGQAGVPFFPPLSADLKEKIPLDPSESSWLHWMELARNLHPFFDTRVNTRNPEPFSSTMSENQQKANARCSLSVALLMILSDYQLEKPATAQTPMAQQIFALELGLIKPEEIHSTPEERARRKYPKNQFSKIIFQRGQQLYSQYLRKHEQENRNVIFQRQKPAEWLKDFLLATNSSVSSQALSNATQRFQELSPQEQLRVLKGLDFCFAAYCQQLKNEKDLVGRLVENPYQPIAQVAQFVNRYFQQKFAPGSAYNQLVNRLNSHPREML